MKKNKTCFWTLALGLFWATGLLAGESVSIPFQVEKKSGLQSEELSEKLKMPEEYYQIASVELEKGDLVSADEDLLPLVLDQRGPQGDFLSDSHWLDLYGDEETLKKVKNVIAIGKEIWSLVEEGRPTVTTAFNSIKVLPLVASEDPLFTLHQMYGWSYPVTQKYTASYKNLFGFTVAKFSFTLIFQHSGKYPERSGQYLTNVNVIPNEIYVAWLFDFNASAEMVDVTNVSATPGHDLPGLTIKVNHVLDNVFNTVRASDSYFITGDGNVQRL